MLRNKYFFLGCVGLYITMTNSIGQSSWTLRSPPPFSKDLNAVTWAGNQFIAVGDKGAIFTSENGFGWVAQKSGTSESLRFIIPGDNQAIAFGTNGTILTTSDGTTWTGRNSGTSATFASGVWSGSLYVAVGGNGMIANSPDGISWTPRTSGTESQLRLVTWTGNQFVAVGDSGIVLISNDGYTWITRNTQSQQHLFSVTWGDSLLWVAGSTRFGYYGRGFPRYLVSADGINWVEKMMPLMDHNDLLEGYTVSRLVRVGKIYIATGYFSNSSGSVNRRTIWVSKDGITWTRADSPDDDALISITWGDNKYLAIGLKGGIFISQDGIEWQKTNGLAPSLRSVVWTGSQIVAVGDLGTVLTSNEGLNWKNQPWGRIELKSIIWTGDKLMAAGKHPEDIHGTIFTSLDGTTRTGPVTVIRYGTSNPLTTLAWNGSVFVAGGDGIHSSPDGIDWIDRVEFIAGIKWSSVIWTGKQFVAAFVAERFSPPVYYPENGYIMTSQDGAAWVSHGIGTKTSLYSVTWSGNQVVAVGDYGTILTSVDGVSWMARNSGTSNRLNSVTWTGSELVAVGSAGTILTSPDGAIWTAENSGWNQQLYSVVATGTQLVAVGEDGVILTSPHISTPVMPTQLVSRKPTDKHFESSLHLTASDLSITLPKSMRHHPVQVVIKSLVGNQIKRIQVTAPGDEIALPIEDLSNGLYLLEIRSGNTRQVQTFSMVRQ